MVHASVEAWAHASVDPACGVCVVVESAAKSVTDFLLIGGGFFGYANEIVATLERRGRRVRWFEDRPAVDNLTKALVRLAPALMAAKAEAYFDAIIEEVRASPIRDVLVIKGESLSPAAIRRLRQALPMARFTLYFWDSYRNMPTNSPDKVPLFDRSFSFDPLDVAADSRLSYRPLFFLDEYACLPNVSQDIDVLFFGTVHTDRYQVLKRLERVLPADLRFDKVLYFPSTAVYRARRVLAPAFWHAQRDEFIFEPLGKGDIQALIARARIVVDVERSVQAGLTMRTMEMLGARKKLITTNSQIRNADFFDPNNIAVIDRLRPVMPSGFLSAPYAAQSAQRLQRYSLSGWLDEVLAD
jgi:hypothetical protein